MLVRGASFVKVNAHATCENVAAGVLVAQHKLKTESLTLLPKWGAEVQRVPGRWVLDLRDLDARVSAASAWIGRCATLLMSTSGHADVQRLARTTSCLYALCFFKLVGLLLLPQAATSGLNQETGLYVRDAPPHPSDEDGGGGGGCREPRPFELARWRKPWCALIAYPEVANIKCYSPPICCSLAGYGAPTIWQRPRVCLSTLR